MQRSRFILVTLALAVVLVPFPGCDDDCDCPDEAQDTEHDFAKDGTEYKVQYHYRNGAGTADYVDTNGNGSWDLGEPCGQLFCPQSHALWVRDAAVSSHNRLIGPPYGFKAPYFSEKPNTICIKDINYRGLSCGSKIAVHDINAREGGEPFIRGIVLHELFHQVQCAYIDPDEGAAWGEWVGEGTADYICDTLFLDIDQNPLAVAASAYLPSAQQYLQHTDSSLIDEHAYDAALLWMYMGEQLGSPFPEPARGIDFLQRFMARAEGKSPATMRYLQETINDFSHRTTSFGEIFVDFCITNYTHDLDLSRLAGTMPDLDFPHRDYAARYRYYDETPVGGNTPYGRVPRTAVAGWYNEYSGSVKRWAAQYLEIDVKSLDLQGCETIGFRGKAEAGKELGWALIGIRQGQVLDIRRLTGDSFYAAFLNEAGDSYQTLAAVVVGLESGSDFTYEFGSGTLTPSIVLPSRQRVARVGTKDNPQRFQIRLHLDGPHFLSPAGMTRPSVRGIDASRVKVTLLGKKSYPATVINHSYIDGEYGLVIQAPTITDPTEGNVFDLEVCMCSDTAGSCQVKANSPQSVIYGPFARNQMIVLDRSGSMGWYGGIKFDAARNASRLAVDAAGEADRMGIVSFWGWRDENRECENEATLVSDLLEVGPNRNVLVHALEGITIGGEEDGWTSIGDGLTTAAERLLANQQLHKLDEDAILLLSDGLPNRRLYWEQDNTVCFNALPVSESFTSDGPYADFKIYTEGLGPDADMGLLTRIAKATDGYAYAVRTDARHCPLSDPLCLALPNRLAESFRCMQEEFLGLERFYYGVFDLAPATPLNVVDIPMKVTELSGGGILNAAFAFNWTDAAAGVHVTLWDPQGRRIDGTNPDWRIAGPSTAGPQTNVVYHYAKVLPPGVWKAQAWSTSKEDQVLCILSGQLVHGVDISLNFSQINDHGIDMEYRDCPPKTGYPPYLRGLPVTIQVNLNDRNGGITGLRDVMATIHNHEAASNQLSLYDDGNHDDGLADDGIYGNMYWRTPFYDVDKVAQDETGPEPAVQSPQTGVYFVFVQVAGKNNAGEDFERFISRSFHTQEYSAFPPCRNPDWDIDGLPDRWESLTGLDPTTPADANLDPDNDGIDNATEFFLGTHPLDPDSDGGGQSDGSEYAMGQDPLYDRDDSIPAVTDYGIVVNLTDVPVHRPRVQTNILHFPADPAYTRMQVWRTDKSDPRWADFLLVAKVDLSVKPRGIFYDTGLLSGTRYYYYLVAEGITGDVVSAPTAYFTATPP